MEWHVGVRLRGVGREGRTEGRMGLGQQGRRWESAGAAALVRDEVVMCGPHPAAWAATQAPSAAAGAPCRPHSPAVFQNSNPGG